MATHPSPPCTCRPAEHGVNRRAFLGGLAATAGATLAGSVGAVHAFDGGGLNAELKRRGRRVILLWLAGGASQLETWDPKPGVRTGGPFASIPTSIPGIHISELMPQMARRMHEICVIRSLNTGDGGHGSAAELMMRGRRNEAALQYPDLGAVVARELARQDSRVPDYVNFYTSTEGRGMARLNPSFLGPRYAPIQLHEETMPPHLARHDSLSDTDHREREEFRRLLSGRFAAGRGTAPVRSHAEAYARVSGLMASQDLFDISNEPSYVRERYGPTQFGEQVMMARKMAEAGVPFVRVSRAWWDSHGQNFETHQEMVPELDRVMAALHDDLRQRGMLDDTLVVAVGEFGRTPDINPSLGRDHFPNAWSAAMFGWGVQRGAVYGKTSDDGKEVTEDEVNASAFFATILAALGIDPSTEYHVGKRPVPLVDYGTEPVRAVLA
ncbi:DUF1501 domain-containing protein [soil metagenome]